MLSTIQKWGNSQAIRLPKFILDIACLGENERVVISAEQDKIMIVKATDRRHVPLLERLRDWDGRPYELTGEDTEWLAMAPEGNEIW